MDDNFLSDIIDKLHIIRLEIPEQVFQGILYLTKFVGYFFPLKLYLPIITLVLGMVLIQILIKIISKVWDIGQNFFGVIKMVKGGK